MDDIKNMQRYRISIENHGHKHVILTELPEKEIANEIEKSYRELKRKLNINSKVYSYPNGNYNTNVINILQNYDYKYAVTTETGFNLWPSNGNNFKLKRFTIHNDIVKYLPNFLFYLIKS